MAALIIIGCTYGEVVACRCALAPLGSRTGATHHEGVVEGRKDVRHAHHVLALARVDRSGLLEGRWRQGGQVAFPKMKFVVSL